MADLYVRVSELPNTLRDALARVGYNRPDISVSAAESYCPLSPGGDGRRSFAAIVELATGRTEVKLGSWGGANMFNPRNAVDLDRNDYPIPPGVAVIEGSEGYKGVYASLLLRPDNIAKLLPAPAEVSERDKRLLAQFRGLSSAGRKNEWERHPESRPRPEEIAALVERGFLKQNKAGACQITTAGKNACAGLWP